MRRFAPLLVLALLLTSGCSGSKSGAKLVRTWVVGATEPKFDPDGPPQALRWSLERLLSRGLVELDSTGHAVLAAADSMNASADGRRWSFHLRPGLRYTDGSKVTSDDFGAALAAGLTRNDHASRAWLLRALSGVDRVRPGRPLPALGIETPDSSRLVLVLASPDPRLPEKLALPGVSTPWKKRDAASWGEAVGIGPYRVAAEQPGHTLVIVRADSRAPARALADTVRVRFVIGAARVRSILRAGAADVAWPMPPAFFTAALPSGYRLAQAEASPARRLLLVLREDVPPTTKVAARFALTHAIDRPALLEALSPRGRPATTWLPDAGALDFPRLDANESQAWLARGKLGASIHVVLAYDADLAGADVARAMQGEWARLGFYAELRGLRGADAVAEPLRAAAAQAQLVEAQALLPGLQGELAAFVMPVRGPAVGAFRTGWRTRDFDPWLLPGKPARPLDASEVQARLVQERTALPLAELPWTWVEREEGGAVRIAARYGPEFAESRPSGGPRAGSR